jgi:nucleoside 2-deoxyribosyltransferase
MTEPAIYLAGPVNAPEDSGRGWRNALVEHYRDGVEFLNPLDEVLAESAGDIVPDGQPTDVGEVTHSELVQTDVQLLRDADAFLIGYSHIRQVGTPMETLLAAGYGYPIALWIRDETPRRGLSPWYHYHVDQITHNHEAAIDWLKHQFVSGDGGNSHD